MQALCKGQSERFGHAHRCDFGGACGPRLAQFVVGDLPFERKCCKKQGMGSRQLSRARGMDGATVIHQAEPRSREYYPWSATCLENMPSPLSPFKGVLLSSVPATLVKTQSRVLQCLPPVLLLQVRAPFPDQSGQLSTGIPLLFPPLQIP